MFWFLFIPLHIKVSLFRRPYPEHPLWIYVVFNIDRRQGTWKPICIIPEDHIAPRRSVFFLARPVLGAYSDGRHQYLFDVIAKRQQHQRYRRPFRRVMNLRGSWQTATQPLSRLSGNSATATVFRIAAKHPTVASPPHRRYTTLTSAQEAVADALRNTWRVSLDDLMAVVREFLNPTMSRSGLDPCLHWRGAERLRDLRLRTY